MQSPYRFSPTRPRDYVLLALVAIGVALRLWQYLASTSLWVDEVFVTTSILDRPMRQLLTVPLAYGQVAPKGFLVMERLFSTALGPGDLVLRLFPMLCSLGGLVCFAFLVRMLLDGIGAPVALALFATAPPLVAYSTQVKQYSSDVAVAVLLLLLAADLSMPKISFRRSWIAGAIGAVAVWFSQPAVLVVGASVCSLALVGWLRRSQDGLRGLLVLAPASGLWSISTLLSLSVSLATLSAHTYNFMHQYWAGAFMPGPPWHLFEILRWPWRELNSLFGHGEMASLGYPFTRIFLLLAACGFWILWRRVGPRATLLFFPILATLFAAIVHQYPFADRLILFLVPVFLVAYAASVDWLYQKTVTRSRYLGWCVGLVLLAPALFPIAAAPPPYRIDDIKPVMAHLEQNWHPGDVVYVFHGALPAFGFYSQDYGFREDQYTLGGCHRGRNFLYREELDAFRGRPRVWVVITHAFPSYHERDDIFTYLDTIGVRRDYFAVLSRGDPGHPSAEAALYDLSDPIRLRNASAQSLPLVGSSSVEARFACGDAPPVIVPPRKY